jgi:hypothetical protein
VRLELLLIDARDASLRIQGDARQGGDAVDVTQLDPRGRAQRLRRVACGAENLRQGHREAAGVCSRDQLLRIRPLPLTEPRVVRIGPLKDAITDGDRSRAVLHIPAPLGAAASDRHPCLLCPLGQILTIHHHGYARRRSRDG